MKQTNSSNDTVYQKTHKETAYLNRLTSIKETESITNNLPKQKAPGSDGFKKLHLFSTISSRRQEQRKYFLTHSMRPALPSYQSRQAITRKYKPISFTNTDAKLFQKISVN